MREGRYVSEAKSKGEEAYLITNNKKRLPSRSSVTPKLKADCDRMIQIVRREPVLTPEDCTLICALVTARGLL